MTEKHFIIHLTEELVVSGTSGKITRNSNSTQFIDVELDGWKLNEGDVLYVELSHYDDDTELTTNVGPLQLFYNEGLGRYVTLAPPELISVAGVWNYSIEQRFNISEDEEGQIKYNSITSAVNTLTVIDSIVSATQANSFVKETELITAARVLKQNSEIAESSAAVAVNAANESRNSADEAAESARNAQESETAAAASSLSAGDSARLAAESGQQAKEYAEAAQDSAEASAASAGALLSKAQEAAQSAEKSSEQARKAQTYASEAKDYANLAAAATSSGLRKVVVHTLPEVGLDNYIYLVPGEATADGNYYDEYLWVKDEETGEAKYEKIGTTRTDLTADNIVMQSDITLAGDYVKVGNISKGSETGTGTFSAKGKTVAQVLEEIFTKRLQPKIVKQPSVYGFSFNRSGQKVEVGTRIDSISVGTLSLDSGAYTYDSETGVEATAYKISRVVNGVASEISADRSCIDTNNGEGFVIGDGTTIAYKGEITYAEGNIATDNLGSLSDPPLRIQAGTAKSSSPLAIAGYRNYFYGAVTDNPPEGDGLTSDFIRGLTKSNKVYEPTPEGKPLPLSVPAGTKGIYIACIATEAGATKIINETALNADVTSTFIKQTDISVEGANGYIGVDYNVWYYIPAVPYENEAILKITLG